VYLKCANLTQEVIWHYSGRGMLVWLTGASVHMLASQNLFRPHLHLSNVIKKFLISINGCQDHHQSESMWSTLTGVLSGTDYFEILEVKRWGKETQDCVNMYCTCMYNVSILSCQWAQVLNCIECLRSITAAVLMVMIKWRLCISVCSILVQKKPKCN
jgi:hypothetical protein